LGILVRFFKKIVLTKIFAADKNFSAGFTRLINHSVSYTGLYLQAKFSRDYKTTCMSTPAPVAWNVFNCRGFRSTVISALMKMVSGHNTAAWGREICIWLKFYLKFIVYTAQIATYLIHSILSQGLIMVVTCRWSIRMSDGGIWVILHNFSVDFDLWLFMIQLNSWFSTISM